MPKQARNMKRLTFTIPIALAERLLAEARRQHPYRVSASEVVRTALEAHLDLREADLREARLRADPQEETLHG